MLGLTADQLCGIYRTQFGVLRKYEYVMRHDQERSRVPNGTCWTSLRGGSRRHGAVGRYVPPFTKPDREAEMRRAYAVFADARTGRGVQ